MCKIVHWIDVPASSCTMVRMRSDDAVHNRIAEVHIRMRHVYFSTQHHLSFLYLAGLHSLKQAQVLFDRTVAERRSNTGFGRCSLLLGNLFRRLFIDISLTLFDKADSQVVELLKVVGSIENLAPFEAEPCNIALDGLYIFRVLFSRVGIVKTQVADTVVFLSDTEVHTDSFDVTDMQIAVRFRRKTCLNTSVINTFS